MALDALGSAGVVLARGGSFATGTTAAFRVAGRTGLSPADEGHEDRTAPIGGEDLGPLSHPTA